MLLGIDVGGTHTDAVAVDESGILASCKVRTNHDNLLDSIEAALKGILAQVDRSQVAQLNLSTTLSTNAIVQNRIDDVGVIISSGPGIDPENFIPCKDFHSLSGSIDHRGTEIAPLDPAELSRAVKACRAAGLKSFAAVTKFSTRNPAHERQIKAALGQGAGGGADFVTLGNEITGRLNFPRRLATAYFNSAVWRTYNRFADAVAQCMTDLGLDVRVNILKADGGTMTLARSRSMPVQSIFSGPAASVMGIIALTRIHYDSVILDIGGTTTDIAIFAEGAPLVEHEGIEIGSHLTLVRALKVRSIGIGGDSAISLTQGVVRVGPNRLGPSAADGGDRPTLTDALNVAGASLYGDIARSRRVLTQFARPHGLDPEDLAAQAIKAAAAKIRAETRDFLAEINEKPVYTIHELLENRRIVPRKVYIMGGPAEAMKMPVFREFQLSTEVPPDFAVANAVGAALTRPTSDVELFADTEKGVVLIPKLKYEGKVGKGYDLEAATAEAKERLLTALYSQGVSMDAANVLVKEASSFNMVSGNRLAGKNIRVRCQVKPGVAFTLREA